MSIERGRKIADAVLYEGYVLYPYRASSGKNQVRWQFGVLAPRQWSDAGGCEHSWSQTECLIENEFEIGGTVRFLQIQRRVVEKLVDSDTFQEVESLEAEAGLWTSWDEAIEREVDFEQSSEFSEGLLDFEFSASRTIEPIVTKSGRRVGRFVRESNAVKGTIRLFAQPIEEARALRKLHLRIENVMPWTDAAASRDIVMRSSLIGVHALLEAKRGKFVSLIDPPEWARAAAQKCSNVHTWPVMVGEDGDRDVVLSSPIILYDYPQIAPESPGDLYDATEIDEILTLRTMTLTEDEKRQARATDPRAAAIIDRVDEMPPEILDRLHGALRYLRAATTKPDPDAPAENHSASVETPPWWDPGADTSVSPESDSVQIGDVSVSKGSRVRLRPGPRRSDAQDMFLAGKTARVEAVYFDVEEHEYLAVTLEDDPAADFMQTHGRFLYFYPDEVEPLEVNQ
ncbi:MAG: hypothetical protein WAU82_15365 [Candidatus Binatus sp.]|uniref:hypothetical protein n=1 Tax=Candidatus Binatus sp. TaxID=2811406 RepID=UPI003BAE9A70